MLKRFVAAYLLLVIGVPTAHAVEPDLKIISAIDSAEFALVQGPEIPRNGTWIPVELTDHWPAERYDVGREGWYRIKITLTGEPKDRIGILLRRLNMNAELYVNGSLVLSGGQFTEPVARNWNYPMFAAPPQKLWRAGDNWIHIRHISYRSYGYLSPVYIGPASLLQEQYEMAYTMQIRIAQFLFPVTLATAFFIFSIWWRRKKDTAYFWFAMAVSAWSMYIVNMFVKQLIVSTKAWEWIAHLSIELWVIAFVIFSYRFVGLRLGRLSWALGGYLAAAAITYAISDLAQLSGNSSIFHAVSLLIGFALVARLTLHWIREKARNAVMLTGGLFVLLATGTHDWMFQTGLTSPTGTLALHIHYYCAPLVFAFIAWHLTARYSTAVDELEDLNLHLEQRIADAESELASRYDQIKSMEQQEAVSSERERIARDLHDTIGGRFSSAIMMADLIRKGKDAEARLELLHDVLADGLTEVRHLVTTMVGDISNTADVIYFVADKSTATLQSVDIGLQLQLDVADESHAISNLQALNIVRVFQEAANNIIKHSTAASATLTASDQNGRLIITLVDAGVGLPEKHASDKTYGIEGMRIRCDEIGASLAVTNGDGGGCSVSLTLKL